MAIKYWGEKVSAKKLAQMVLADSATVEKDYWNEKSGVDYDAMTEREREQVAAQMDALTYRIHKLLGFPHG